MGRERGMYRTEWRRNERPHWSERATWKDYTKMDLTETSMEGVNGIQLARDSRKWRVIENTTMNLRVPQNVRNFLIANLLLSQGLCSMELALPHFVFTVLHQRGVEPQPNIL
jgi:hypothetical protein